MFKQVHNKFIDLDDTPTSYSGFPGHGVNVTNSETGLEFTEKPVASGVEYINFGVGKMQRGAAGERPSVTIYGPIAGYGFDDTDYEYMYGSFKIPTNIKEMDHEVIIHGFNAEAQTGTNTCSWKIEYQTINDYEIVTGNTSTSVSGTRTLPNNVSAGMSCQYGADLDYDDSNNPLTKSLFNFVFYRDCDNDTMTGDAVITLITFKFYTKNGE